MNLPNDPRRRPKARAVITAAACVLTAANAAAAAFVVTVATRRPAALSPGERVPLGAGAGKVEGRRVLLVLGDDSAEDLWAFSAAGMIEQASPGHVTALATAPRIHSSEGGLPVGQAPPSLRRWVQKRLPLLPALLFLENDETIAAAHVAPIAPHQLAAGAASFPGDDSAAPEMQEPPGGDSRSPFSADVLDGPAAIEHAAADPAAASFLERFASRTVTRRATLLYDPEQGYSWHVEFRAAPCGCSTSSASPAARVILRPSDGAVLSRDFLADSRVAAGPSQDVLPPSLAPPDSEADLSGRW